MARVVRPREPVRKRPYTEDEILRAMKLQEAGNDWVEVGEILDRTPGSLEVTVCNYRRGKWSPKKLHEQIRLLDERIYIWVQKGMSVGQMAQAAGLPKTRIQSRLKATGYDMSVRREIASAHRRSCQRPQTRGLTSIQEQVW